MRRKFYFPVRNFSARGVRGFCFRLAAAVILFGLVVGFSGSGGGPGRLVREAVHYMLTRHYDLTGYGARIGEIIRSVREAVAPAGKQGLEVEVTAPPQKSACLLPDLPVSGRLVRDFGWQQDSGGWPRFSEGIELSVREGIQVRAVLSGKVSRVAEDKSLGKIIVIDHEQSCSTLYGMLGGVGVRQGQDVAQGQVIGTVSGTLFHFELREGDSLVDPLARLQQQ